MLSCNFKRRQLCMIPSYTLSYSSPQEGSWWMGVKNLCPRGHSSSEISRRAEVIPTPVRNQLTFAPYVCKFWTFYFILALSDLTKHLYFSLEVCWVHFRLFIPIAEAWLNLGNWWSCLCVIEVQLKHSDWKNKTFHICSSGRRVHSDTTTHITSLSCTEYHVVSSLCTLPL